MEITYKANKTIAGGRDIKINFRDFSEMESFSEP